MPASDLAEIITNYSSILSEIARRDGGLDDNFFIALESIDTGSVRLRYVNHAMQALFLSSVVTYSAAIKNNDISGLPVRAIESTKNLVKISEKLNAPFEICERSSDNPLARITSELAIPESVYTWSGYSFFGKVVRVGGTDPKVGIKEISGRKIPPCEVSELLAMELAKHLYKNVQIFGQAKIDIESLEIVAFKAERFERVGSDERISFDSISEEFGEFFSDIDDPTAYIDEMRKDTDDS